MTETTGSLASRDRAERLKQLPPYLFVELDRAKRTLISQGEDVIDLGVGDPDLPTPPEIVARLKEAVDDAANHRYSMTEGLRELREAIARWYARRFAVELDPSTEIVPLLGSKEGIGHLPLALANPGDVVLVPDPCYPPYRGGATLAGAQIVPMPLLEENSFFPDLGALSQRAVRQAKLMFLNYPNNPTAAVASLEQFEEAVALAKEYGFALAHDAAYSEVAFGGYQPPSLLQVPEAKSLAIEFHSLSKTFNMTGWRIGWACGNAALVGALAQLKTNLDSGIFQPIQWAGITALERGAELLRDTLQAYHERRELLVGGLSGAGWHVTPPKAGLYVWTRVPAQEPSMAFATRILEQAQVIVTPGVGFGPSGEGYVRMSLTVPTARLREAVERLKKAL